MAIENVAIEPGEELRVTHLGDRLKIEVYSHGDRARLDVTYKGELRVVRMPSVLRLGKGKR